MVSMERRDKAVDRVQKMLAIAARATTMETERVAMKRQAHRLITEHGIAEHEITARPQRAPRPAPRPAPRGQGFTWEALLQAMVVAVDDELARKKQRRRRR